MSTVQSRASRMEMIVCCRPVQKQLSAEHASYAAHHPDLRALLSDFVQHLLIDKPTDVLEFCSQYFDAFSPGYTTSDVIRTDGSGTAGSAESASVHGPDTAEPEPDTDSQPVDDATEAARRSTQKTGSVA